MESPESVDPCTSPTGSRGASQGGGDTSEGKRVHRVKGHDGSTRVISACAGEGGERTPVSTASRVVPESSAWSGEPPASCPGSPYPAQVANQLVCVTPIIHPLFLTLC